MKTRKQLPKKKENTSNLYKLRKDKGYTQEQIAKMIGCTAKTYANYEREISDDKYQKPFIEHLTKLADMFDVSTDYILGRSHYTSAENQYIGKRLGLSDDAIKGFEQLIHNDKELWVARELSKQYSGKRYAKFSNFHISVINCLFSHYDIFRHFLLAFIDYAIPFQFSIPVTRDSKGKWKKIDVSKTPFALASDEQRLDDNKEIPLNFITSKALAKTEIDTCIDALRDKYIRYALEKGVIDAEQILLDAYLDNKK